MITALNKKYLHSLLILFLNLLFLSGCNQNSDQREFEQQAFSEPSGITKTDQIGTVIGNPDPDDWRISPFFQGDVELLSPPYPNPVLSNGELRIEILVYVLHRISEINIFVYRPPLFYRVDDRPQVPTGNTAFNIPANIIARENLSPQGYYRIIIQDENGNVITYGDVEIE